MEFLDIVDDQDEVIAYASIRDIYFKKLPHRIVHVFIFNDKDELALQKRSINKDFCPSHWSTAVGGHVQQKESYLEAAKREFKEELGTTAELEEFKKDVYIKPNGPKKFLTTFKAKFNGPFNENPEEVERVDFFSLEKIQEMVNSGEKFHPELLFLLKKHFNIKA